MSACTSLNFFVSIQFFFFGPIDFFRNSADKDARV